MSTHFPWLCTCLIYLCRSSLKISYHGIHTAVKYVLLMNCPITSSTLVVPYIRLAIFFLSDIAGDSYQITSILWLFSGAYQMKVIFRSACMTRITGGASFLFNYVIDRMKCTGIKWKTWKMCGWEGWDRAKAQWNMLSTYLREHEVLKWIVHIKEYSSSIRFD